jgi:hypothetical protein
MIAKPKNLSAVTDLTQLPGRVNVVNADEVLAYLAQYPELIPILPDLCAKTRAEFGDEAELQLELVHDYEIYDPHLVLCVRLRNYDDTVLPRIFAIDAIFEDRLTDAEGWLSLTTDFRTLR